MNYTDVVIERDIRDSVLERALAPQIKEAFNKLGLSSPDKNRIWVDKYQRRSGTTYYRVSFYVAAPPTSLTWAKGEHVRDVLNGDGEAIWSVHYCRAVSRKSDAIKVHAKFEA